MPEHRQLTMRIRELERYAESISPKLARHAEVMRELKQLEARLRAVLGTPEAFSARPARS